MLRLTVLALICVSLFFTGCKWFLPRYYHANYPGFYAIQKDKACVAIVVEDPARAQVYGFVSGGGVALRDLHKEDLSPFGFKTANGRAWRKKFVNDYSYIEFSESGEVIQVLLGKQADDDFTIAPTSDGPWLTLPTPWDNFEKAFGKPLSRRAFYREWSWLP